MERYKPIFSKQKFTEKLSFNDLRKNAGISALTKQFKKSRGKKLKGGETSVTKLKDVSISRSGNYIDFKFETRVTPYPEDPDHTYGETNPPDWAIKKNQDKRYTEIIRILDFFDWLETTPEDITKQDIEDVLNVADVQVSCSCPSFNWQGMAYNLTQLDASIYTQTIPDPVWGPRHNNDNILCKHLQGLINQIAFYVPQMRQKIIKAVR